MGYSATFVLRADAITSVETFVNVFISLYGLVILLYIITSWLRLPYSPTLNRIQRFLYDVCEPYLRFWRRLLPLRVGAFDFSPIVGILAVYAAARIVNVILGQFH